MSSLPSAVYLAGPMRGYPRYNFPAFIRAAAALRARGIAVVSPAEHELQRGFDPDGDRPFTTTAADSFRWDLEKILELANDRRVSWPPAFICFNAAVFLPRWRASEGARIERAVAHYAGLPCYDLVGGRFLVPQTGEREVLVSVDVMSSPAAVAAMAKRSA